MKKLFKFIINIFLLMLVVLAIAGYFYYKPWQNWCNKQYNKAKGVYHIYQGDKALEKSRAKNANIAKELTNAIKLYNKGLKEYPQHYQARCNLANIYVIFEDYSDALEQYRLALKYKPDYLECRMNLGLLEVEELSKFDEAIDQFTKVATSNKKPKYIPFILNEVDSTKENKINAYYNIGLSYRGKTLFTPKDRLKDNQYLKEAVKAYNKSVEAYNKSYRFNKKKNNYDTLFNLALTHHYLGNNREAGLNYCKAIKSAPLNYEAHLNLGILLNSMKEYDEAIKELTIAGMLINEGNEETIIYLNDLLNDTYKKNAIMKEINAQKRFEYQQQEPKKSFWDIFKKKEKSEDEQKEEEIIYNDNNIKKCESEKIFKEML